MIVTLHDVRQYLKLEPSEAQADTVLLMLIRGAQAMAERYLSRSFEPLRATRLYDFNWENSRTYLDLKADLLALEVLTNGDGTTIASTDYILEYPNIWPKSRICLLPTSNVWFEPDLEGDNQQSISAQGLWGYHADYPLAWVDSLDTTENSPLAIDGTSIVVNDLDGVTDDFRSPRFLPGHLLRLADSDSYEFVSVLSLNKSSQTLQVKRGSRGTTASAWPQNTPIEIWRPDTLVELGMWELVRILHGLIGTNLQGVSQIVGTGIKVTPESLPDHVLAMFPPPKVSLTGE